LRGQEVRFVDKDRPALFDEPTKVVTKVVTNELAATIFLVNFSPTLALLQHSPRDRTLACGHRLYLVSRKVKIFLGKDPVSYRLRGNMDELIARLAVKAGIDNAVAEKTIGIVLDFLRNEGPSDKVQALIDKIPGAETAIAASSNSGGLAGLMGGGLMALGTKLMGLGLGMGEIQSVARELFRFGRDKIGADQMGEIIAGTPGLSQFA
jgi:hypothetical protein